MAVVSRRVTIGLGVLAAAVAVVALAGLALAALVSPDSGGGGSRSGADAFAIERLGTTPPAGDRAAAPAPAGGEEQAAAPSAPPVPALDGRPVRGPSFAIARLRPGAGAPMWDAPGGEIVETLGPRTEFGSPTILSVVRTRPGWLGVATPNLPNGKLGWIRRDPIRFDLYWTKYSLHADLSDLSLTLRYGRTTVSRFLVTVGAPGSETPLGRYGITDALSFNESPFYGCCALALSGRQTQLPEGWIGGDRLAIHGTPGPVGGAESHGCIRATDATMRTLFRRVPLGAPVFVDA
jgi:hypothetical protein